MTVKGVGSPAGVTVFAPNRTTEFTTIQVPQGKINGLEGPYEFPHVRISGLQKTLNAPTDAAPEKTSLLERVSSTAGAMVPFAASPIREMECMLTAVTKAGERERQERVQADEATSELIAALLKSNQALAKENKTLKGRVIVLESAQRELEAAHKSVLQACKGRLRTKIQALQAEVEALKVQLRSALLEQPQDRLMRWSREASQPAGHRY